MSLDCSDTGKLLCATGPRMAKPVAISCPYVWNRQQARVGWLQVWIQYARASAWKHLNLMMSNKLWFLPSMLILRFVVLAAAVGLGRSSLVHDKVLAYTAGFKGKNYPSCYPTNSVIPLTNPTHPFYGWPLHRSTCVSRHFQLRTGGFCWCKVLLPTCPC